MATPSWTSAELARAVGRSKNDGTVRRALQGLARRNVITRAGDGRWYAADPLPGLDAWPDDEADA